MTDPVTPGAAFIVYDGQCIYCTKYVELLRLREAIGAVDLVDARSADPRVRSCRESGYDLNTGMLFVYRGQTFHGAQALQVLADLSSRANWWNRLNALIFRHPRIARALYPALRLGRNITLRLLGRKQIDNAPSPR